MVGEEFLDEFLRWLLMVVGNLFEGGVEWGKDSEIGCCTVKEGDELFIFINQLGKLCSIFRLVDKLIHRLVRFSVMRRVVRFVGWMRSMVRWSIEEICLVIGRLEPALASKSFLEVVFDIDGVIFSMIHCIFPCILCTVECLADGLLSRLPCFVRAGNTIKP